MGTLARQSDPAVLVVDDDFDVRATLREMLEEVGLRVFEAPNGQAALDVLGSLAADIHLILLDLRMPIMSGWDFLELLRTDVRLSPIPVVIISATPTTPDTVEHPSVVARVQIPYVMSRLREIVTSLAPVS
jgi:CheY-like chemotaxis protein